MTSQEQAEIGPMPARPALARRIVSRRVRQAYRADLDAWREARQEAAWMAFWKVMHEATRRPSRPAINGEVDDQ